MRILKIFATAAIVACYMGAAHATALTYALRIVYFPGQDSISNPDRCGKRATTGLTLRKRHLTTAKKIVLTAGSGRVIPFHRISRNIQFVASSNPKIDLLSPLGSCQPYRAPPASAAMSQASRIARPFPYRSSR